MIHFYHLHALDWVDIVSALKADPAETSKLAQSISPWPKSSTVYFKTVQDRLKKFVESGQLGLFANGYWGHPAYKLPPAANLMAVAHYLEALDWQREVIKIHAILGSKNPHPQTYLVGGMAIPLDPNSAAALNADKLALQHELLVTAKEFVDQVYIPDLLAIAPFYKDWAAPRRRRRQLPLLRRLSHRHQRRSGAALAAARRDPEPRSLDGAPDGPQADHRVGHPLLVRVQRRGRRLPGTPGTARPIRSTRARSRPTSSSTPTRSTPGSRRRATTACRWRWARWRACWSPTRRATRASRPRWTACSRRWASARRRSSPRSDAWRPAASRRRSWPPSCWSGTASSSPTSSAAISGSTTASAGIRPLGRSEAQGWGFHEAPRGALGHWVRIKDGAIVNYQCVVPSTWNASPRDAKDQRGPYEASLVGTPGRRRQPARGDPAHRPLLRSVHGLRGARAGTRARADHPDPGGVGVAP